MSGARLEKIKRRFKQNLMLGTDDARFVLDEIERLAEELWEKDRYISDLEDEIQEWEEG